MQFEHVMRPALRMGIDGVFSDHVDVMVDAFTAELGSGLNRRTPTTTASGARPEHDERPADEVVLVDRAEGAAVLRAAAVVAHHEDVVLGDGDRRPARRRSCPG